MKDNHEGNNLLFLAVLHYLFQKKNITNIDTRNFYLAFIKEIQKPALSRKQIKSLMDRLDKNVSVKQIISRCKGGNTCFNQQLFDAFVAPYQNQVPKTASDLEKFLLILCLKAALNEEIKYRNIYLYWQKYKDDLEKIYSNGSYGNSRQSLIKQVLAAYNHGKLDKLPSSEDLELSSDLAELYDSKIEEYKKKEPKKKRESKLVNKATGKPSPKGTTKETPGLDDTEHYGAGSDETIEARKLSESEDANVENKTAQLRPRSTTCGTKRLSSDKEGQGPAKHRKIDNSPPTQAVYEPKNDYCYTSEDINVLLKLRLNQNAPSNVHILAAACLNHGEAGNRLNDILESFFDANHSLQQSPQTLLIPIQVGEHWVGVNITLEQGIISKLTYYNSLRSPEDEERIKTIHREIEETKRVSQRLTIGFSRYEIPQPDDKSCGPFLVENLARDVKNCGWQPSTNKQQHDALMVTIRKFHWNKIQTHDPDYFKVFEKQKNTVLPISQQRQNLNRHYLFANSNPDLPPPETSDLQKDFTQKYP